VIPVYSVPTSFGTSLTLTVPDDPLLALYRAHGTNSVSLRVCTYLFEDYLVDQEQSPSSFYQLLTHHQKRQSACSKQSNRITPTTHLPAVHAAGFVPQRAVQQSGAERHTIPQKYILDCKIVSNHRILPSADRSS